MTIRESSDDTAIGAAEFDRFCKNLNGRLDEILAHQRDSAEKIMQHDSRIAVLEARPPNPGNHESRLSVLEQSVPEELPARLSVLESNVPSKLGERLRSLEEFRKSSQRFLDRWQGVIVVVVQFIILGAVGYLLFGKPGP
jgi:hypothetical protein